MSITVLSQTFDLARRIARRAVRFTASPSLNRLGWLLAFLYLSACSSQTPLEKTAEDYWRVLQTGEVGRAYRYLSSGDREVISEEAFSSRVRFELYPHLFFSQYGGARLEVITDAEAAQEGVAFTEVSEVVRAETYAAATARLVAPDYRSLGGTFTAALGRPDAPLSVVQEQRLAQALRNLRQPPLKETRHRFKLIQEEGAWRVTYPLWRVEAALASAETLAADGALQEAQDLLAEVGRFAANLDSETRAAVTRTASRGRRMLPHLARVRLTDFTLGSGDTCQTRASLSLRNEAYDLRTATVVVDFEVRGETRAQRFVLGEVEGPIAKGESAYFELCLEPPPGWRGQANARVTWLDFTEKVYKSRF